MNRRSATERVATAIYRASLAFLPREFRDQYRDELIACFAGIAADARRRGRFAVLSVLVHSLIDLGSGGARQHLRAAHAEVTAPGGVWMGTWQDFRFAARRLLRRPSFTLVSVITLGLGMAAATSVFSLVNAVILSPLPYSGSDRIVQVDHGGRGIGIDRGLGITHGFYRYYRAHLRSVESMALYSETEVTLTGAGDPEQLATGLVTPSLATVLQVPPRVGRWFDEDEGKQGGWRVVLLSEQLWTARFARDPGIVGRTINLNGAPVEVIGVMPAVFAFPHARISLWLPYQIPTTGVGGWGDRAIARLTPAATAAALEKEITALFAVLRRDTDDPAKVTSYLDDAKIFPRVVSLKDDLIGEVRITLWVLLGAVGFVLLIAVANVANLFLVRAEEGQREVAVRTALGAARSRLVRASLAETLLLALAAGALGLAAASAAVRLLRLHAPINIPRQNEISLGPESIALSLAVTLVAAFLLGLIPLVGRRGDLGVVLKEGGRRSTSGRIRMQSRSVLVAVQVALALVLLIGSSLLLRTYASMRAVPLGFAERNAVVFDLRLPGTRYRNRADAKQFNDRLAERLAAIPGVRSAGGVGSCLPLNGYMCYGEVLEVEGKPTPAGVVPPVTGVRVASTGYFRTIGIPVRGRTFTPGDETGKATVTILSQAAAEAYFPDEDPIGRRIRFGGSRSDSPWQTVVGVAGNVRVRIESDEFQRVIYFPQSPEATEGPSPASMSWVVASTVPSTSVVPELRRVMDELDPLLPLANLGTLRAMIDRSSAPAAFSLTLVALAACIALLLGAVGVYAVIAYAVSRRTAEIGVRLALGARAADVRWMVLRQGGLVVALGIVAGLAGAFVLTRMLRAMLFGVSPTDWVSYAGQTAVMLLVALLALYLPARAASKVDPMEALRAE